MQFVASKKEITEGEKNAKLCNKTFAFIELQKKKCKNRIFSFFFLDLGFYSVSAVFEVTSEGNISNIIHVNVMEADNMKFKVFTVIRLKHPRSPQKKKAYISILLSYRLHFFSLGRLCSENLLWKKKKKKHFILTLPHLLLLILLKGVNRIYRGKKPNKPYGQTTPTFNLQ